MIPLGPFELEASIGRGGMGEVWRGVHRENRAPIAVKVITAERALRPHYLAAFKNEVRATAGLDHPSIVMVLDYGQIDETAARASEGHFVAGSPFLAMELLAGGSLKKYVAKLAWPELCAVLLRLLDALAHAHARGMVHRDIKPPNVLFDRTVHGVKITDFGLAHALEPDATHEDRFKGGGVGTPGYMAPEQIQKRWRDYGPWTDLYAFGCLAYEMACGRPPFGKAAGSNTMRAHLSQKVPPLSAKMAVPPGFEAWIERLLEKEPERRFRRAADAAHQLLKLGAAVSSEATEEKTVDQVQAFGAEPATLSSLDTAVEHLAQTELVEARPRSRPLPPIEIPPFVSSWRQPARVRRGAGESLGLWGLRSIPLVDRDAERDVLWSLLGRVRETSRPHLVLLEGAAGAGKTRLAEWLGERAHELGTATVLRALHTPERGPQDGLGPMLSRFLRLGGLGRVEIKERIEQLFVSHDLTNVNEHLAMTDLVAPLRFSAPNEKYAVLVRFLERVARERPLILFVDDGQWALDTLRFCELLLSEKIAELPVLLVITVREEALAERVLEAEMLNKLAKSPRARRLDIGPLPPEHRGVLVRELLGLEGELAGRVEERTAGNPLFAVQLVGDWVERGILEPGPRGLRLKEGAEAPLPDDVHQVWSERLERILSKRTGDDRNALMLAAVLGQEVDVGEWKTILAWSNVSPSSSLIESLLVQRLLRAGERGPEHSFSFVHGMLRESLERMSREEGTWMAYNAAAAEVLAEPSAPGAKERLGRHLFQAGLPDRAIEPLTEGALERIDCGEYRIAEVLLADRERAVVAADLPDRDQRRGEGWVHRGRLFGLLGDPVSGETWTRKAIEEARKHEWHRVAGMAYRELGRLARQKGEHRRAAIELELAQAYAKRIGDQRLLAEASRDVAYLHLARGSLELAAEYFGFALAEYESIGEELGVARCALGLGELSRETGRLDEAKVQVTRALELFERCASRKGVSDCFNALGEVARLSGDLVGAEMHYREALEIRRALGVAQSFVCELNIGLVQIERGHYAQAKETLEECLATVERQSNRKMMGSVHVCLLVPSMAVLDLAAFDLNLRAGAMLLGETGFVDVDNARMASLAGDLAAQNGELDRAKEAYALARHQWKALGRTAEEEETTLRIRTIALAPRS